MRLYNLTSNKSPGDTDGANLGPHFVNVTTNGTTFHAVVSDSLQPHYSPWNSPGQSTWMGSLSLFQGIPSPGDLPNPGIKPSLPHCRWILYQLNHKGSPRILEWVAYPFLIISSQPRNRTEVSCIAGRFFTNWATKEAPHFVSHWLRRLLFLTFSHADR